MYKSGILKMSWMESGILTGNLIVVVPILALFQNFKKLEIVVLKR